MCTVYGAQVAGPGGESARRDRSPHTSVVKSNVGFKDKTGNATGTHPHSPTVDRVREDVAPRATPAAHIGTHTSCAAALHGAHAHTTPVRLPNRNTSTHAQTHVLCVELCAASLHEAHQCPHSLHTSPKPLSALPSGSCGGRGGAHAGGHVPARPRPTHFSDWIYLPLAFLSISMALMPIRSVSLHASK